jgi:hypothetical protein
METLQLGLFVGYTMNPLYCRLKVEEIYRYETEATKLPLLDGEDLETVVQSVTTPDFPASEIFDEDIQTVQHLEAISALQLHYYLSSSHL